MLRETQLPEFRLAPRTLLQCDLGVDDIQAPLVQLGQLSAHARVKLALPCLQRFEVVVGHGGRMSER